MTKNKSLSPREKSRTTNVSLEPCPGIGYSHSQSSSGASGAGELTEREEQVLRLVAQGHTNKEIANKLNISVKTVETHKANLMKKLDFKSRTEIVRYAVHRGWLQNT